MTIKPSQVSVTGNADGTKYAGSYRFILLMSNMVWISLRILCRLRSFWQAFASALFFYIYIYYCNIWYSLSSFGAMMISVRRFLLRPSADSLSATGIYSPRPLGWICNGFTP